MKRHSIRYRPDSPSRPAAQPRTGAGENLQSALVLNGMGSFHWDRDSGELLLDPGGLVVMGLRPGEYDGDPRMLGRRILPDDIDGLQELIERSLASQPGGGAYFRVRHPDGTVRWKHAQGRILRDDAGRARRVTGIVRDATDELIHQAEQKAIEAERRRQTDVVQTLTHALSQALSVQDVTEAVTSEVLRERLGAVSVSLGVVEQGHTRVVGAAGLPKALIRDLAVSRLSAPMPFAEAVRTRTPRFLSRDAMRDRYPRLWPYLRRATMTRCAILPLIAQAKPIGALAMAFQDRAGFLPEECNLLLALASTIAQSLQRSVLYDNEHEMAVGLQHAMLPARLPECAGASIAARYRPAHAGRYIGGDWYDAIPLPSGNIGIVVGDVEGHDVQAAAVMGQLRTVLRAYAAEGHAPASVIAHASAFLLDLDADRFATCTYADLDPVTGDAHVVRAGHLGPLVKDADGTCCAPQAPGGPPLGLQTGDRYPVASLRLRATDTLLLYTDGLVEHQGMDIDDGLVRLQTVVHDGPPGPEELADHVIHTIESRYGLHDDAALLLARLPRAAPAR